MRTTLTVGDSATDPGTEFQVVRGADGAGATLYVSKPKGGTVNVVMTKAETIELGRQLVAVGESL